jgi:hypothetical protein
MTHADLEFNKNEDQFKQLVSKLQERSKKLNSVEERKKLTISMSAASLLPENESIT